MATRRLKQTFAILVLGALATGAAAEADPFAQGRLGVSVVVGTGQTASDSYYTVGAGLNYYLLNGLWLGISGETRQGIHPVTYSASPEIGFVFPVGGPVRPYVGAFASRTWVENFRDFDTYGGRAGVLVRMGQGAHMRIGAVYESLRGCANTPPSLPCSDTYGEFGLLFGF